METNKLQVMTLANVALYDELIKQYITDADAAVDAKSLKSVAIDGHTLKFYNVEEPVGETAPVKTIELPKTDLSDILTRLATLESGKADKAATLAGYGITDAYTKDEVNAAIKVTDDKAVANAEAIEVLNGDAETEGSVAKAVADAKALVDADIKDINDTIGEVTEGKTVVEMITDAQEAATYDDTQVKADIKTNADAIKAISDDYLKGADKTELQGNIDALADVIGEIAEDKTVAKMIEEVQKAIEDEAARADEAEKANKALIDANAEAINTEKERAEAAEKVNADAIAALAGKVGEVEEGKTVVGMIAENAQAVEEHKNAVDAKVTTLIGEDVGKSVRTIANEELAAQLIGENAKESLDTLEEIAAWIQNHPDDASAMNKAIEDLEALVGTLPEGVTATTIAGYVAEAVAAEKARAEGVEGGLDTRLQAVEEALGDVDGSVADQIDAKIADLDADIKSAEVEEGKGVRVQVVEVDGKVTTVSVTGNYDNAYDAKGAAATAETNAKDHADTEIAKTNENVTANSEAITALQTLVGEGYEAIPEADIRALFA